MTRRQKWINEFVNQYLAKGGFKGQAQAVAQKQALAQEMIHGSIVDIWEPADSAGNQ